MATVSTVISAVQFLEKLGPEVQALIHAAYANNALPALLQTLINSGLLPPTTQAEITAIEPVLAEAMPVLSSLASVISSIWGESTNDITQPPAVPTTTPTPATNVPSTPSAS